MVGQDLTSMAAQSVLQTTDLNPGSRACGAIGLTTKPPTLPRSKRQSGKTKKINCHIRDSYLTIRSTTDLELIIGTAH